MNILDVESDRSLRCGQCGICKAFFPLFLPSCPSGQRFGFNSYFATGRLMIGKGLRQGILNLEDDDLVERIYTCTACRACDEICDNLPKDHIVDTVKGMRQMAVSEGCITPAHLIMFESLKKNDNVLDKPKEERGAWAQGLDLKNIAMEKVDVAYRVGCLLSFDPEVWGVAREAMGLIQQAGVDVGIEGKDEVCCGGRAYELGHLAEFTKYAEHNIDAYNKAGVSKVVVSCSDGLSHLKLLYPSVNIKMNFEVLHVVEYVDQLIKEGKIKFTNKVPMKVTYHDPCHLGRYMGIYDPPRDILHNIPGLDLIEMERSREYSWCCGAGAGVKQAYPDLSLWTAIERIKEAKDTGAAALVTSCPWCEKNFRDAINESGDKIEVYDIIEIVRQAI